MFIPFLGIVLFSCFILKKWFQMHFDFTHDLLKLEKLVYYCLVIFNLHSMHSIYFLYCYLVVCLVLQNDLFVVVLSLCLD